jgi:hypothetical protein
VPLAGVAVHVHCRGRRATNDRMAAPLPGGRRAFRQLKKAERRDARVEKRRKKGWIEVLLVSS